MPRPTQDFVRIREIAAEHAAIAQIVQGIERELDRLLERPAAPGEPWELPDLTRALDEHLARHFRLEESGGLLGSAARYYAPQARAEAERLISEHREFQRRMTRILDELTSIRDPAAVVQSCFDGEIRRLLADMARHEEDENQLLREVLGPGHEPGT